VELASGLYSLDVHPTPGRPVVGDADGRLRWLELESGALVADRGTGDTAGGCEVSATDNPAKIVRTRYFRGTSAWRYPDGNYWKPHEQQQWPHAISTSVWGTATYDLDRERFLAFDLVALGERRDRTVMQGRGSAEPSPIGIACELAPAGWRVAPTFVNVYDVDWVAPLAR